MKAMQIIIIAHLISLSVMLFMLRQRVRAIEDPNPHKRFQNEPDDFVKWFVTTWGQQEPSGKWMYVEVGLHQNGTMTYRWTETKPLINTTMP